MALDKNDKKWIMEMFMQFSDAIMKGMEGYATKENLEEKLEETKLEIKTDVKNEIRMSEGRIIKVIKSHTSRLDKLEHRVYKLENKAFN